jgi:ABC-type multidrug transport system fused ATPase/permease subunit
MTLQTANETEPTEKNNDTEEIAKKSILNFNKINTVIKSSQLKIFFGFMLAGIFGLLLEKALTAAGSAAVRDAIYAILTFAGLLLMYSGIYHILKMKKLAAYLELIKPETATGIKELSIKLNKPSDHIRKDLQMFLSKNYLYGTFDLNCENITLIKTETIQTGTDTE